MRGWLFARGAFDRNDLVYLRNEEERRRLAEREQDASERQAVRPPPSTAAQKSPQPGALQLVHQGQGFKDRRAGAAS